MLVHRNAPKLQLQNGPKSFIWLSKFCLVSASGPVRGTLFSSQPDFLSAWLEFLGASDVNNPPLWSWGQPSAECHNSGYTEFWKMVGCKEGYRGVDRDESWTYLTSRNWPMVRSRRYPIIGTSLWIYGEVLSAWMSVRMFCSTSPGDHAQPGSLLALLSMFFTWRRTHTGMLNNNNHVNSARLTNVMDVIDGSSCSAASSFDHPSSVGVEIEVACWVYQRIGLIASD